MHFERHTTIPEAARFFLRFHERQNFFTACQVLDCDAIFRPSRHRRDRRACIARLRGRSASDRCFQPTHVCSQCALSRACRFRYNALVNTPGTCCAVKRGTRDDGPPFPAS